MDSRGPSLRRLRVGLVGCGSVALVAHIPAFLHLTDDFRVVAVADPTPALRERAQKLLGLADEDAYTSHEELIARDDVDVVDVCTPPNVRRAIVVDAARAGKQILCEKPLATVPKEAQEMVRAARAAGVRLGLVHNYLYLPELAASPASRAVARGIFGLAPNTGADGFASRAAGIEA